MHEKKTENIDDATINGLKTKNWFLRRPIPVWIIFAFGTLSIIGVIRTMVSAKYIDLVISGAIPLFEAIVFLLYPFLFFIGSVFLFAQRRSAFYIFITYFVWGVGKIIHGTNYPAYLSLALVAGICVYCWRLTALGELK